MIPSRAEEMMWKGTSPKCPYKQQRKIWCSSDHDRYRDAEVYFSHVSDGAGRILFSLLPKRDLSKALLENSGKHHEVPPIKKWHVLVYLVSFLLICTTDGFRFALPDPERVGRKSTSNPGLGVFSWHPDYVSIYHNHLKRRNPHAIRTEHT